ncbi:MAG: helix-turn-helix domain-containing protein [Thermoanaerobaculia bacterium]
MKERTLEGFGERLAQVRQSRGITQAELGKAVGVSNRVIAYYEQDGAQPPGAMLVDLAKALRVSSDQLLGLKPVREKTSPRTARLLRRLQRIEELPAADRKAVLKILDGLRQARGRTQNNGRR